MSTSMPGRNAVALTLCAFAASILLAARPTFADDETTLDTEDLMKYAPKWGVVGPGEVRQFDIVYGPYSSRYAGNSMGDIVNITTHDPVATEAFTTAQGFSQSHDQFATDRNYHGYSAEAGFGWKHQDGPFSLRVTGRYFQSDGHPMSWYGLAPVTGAPGTTVTGAIVDAEQQRATFAAGRTPTGVCRHRDIGAGRAAAAARTLAAAVVDRPTAAAPVATCGGLVGHERRAQFDYFEGLA
jgi:hypothetical protein